MSSYVIWSIPPYSVFSFFLWMSLISFRIWCGSIGNSCTRDGRQVVPFPYICFLHSWEMLLLVAANTSVTLKPYNHPKLLANVDRCRNRSHLTACNCLVRNNCCRAQPSQAVPSSEHESKKNVEESMRQATQEEFQSDQQPDLFEACQVS